MSATQTAYVVQLHQVARTVYRSISNALADADDNGYGWPTELEDALKVIDVLVSDTTDDAAARLKLVAWQWSTVHGACYDCGAPAAFRLTDAVYTEASADENRFCAVCAANHAADGSTIARLDR